MKDEEDKCMDTLNLIKDFLWDKILIYLLLGTGIFFTVRLGFPQIVKLPQAMKEAFGGVFQKKGVKEVGQVSSFAALATAIAAQVGTGNIGGVASAIMTGGPGAVFWMWVSGILGMSTIFAEAVLAQVFRQEKDGQVYGGPAYYLSKGLKNKTLGRVMAVCFAVFIILALGIAGNMVQSNSIALSLEQGFGIKPLYTGILLAVLVGLIVVGGVQRISKIAELVVPFMAAIFIIAGVVVIIKYHGQLGSVFAGIFTAAFTPRAVLGGSVGFAVKKAMQLGLARGLFSNEAGMGSTPHAHAVANVPHPVNQGLVAMAGVVVDTLIICTMTALVVLLTGAQNVSSKLGLTSVAVTQKGFELAFGTKGVMFLAVSLFFFAFTTVIGWYYFGEANISYLFGKKGILPYRIAVILAILVGTVLKAQAAWDLSDLFNGLMVIPNVVGILLLSGIVAKKKKEFENLPK